MTEDSRMAVLRKLNTRSKCPKCGKWNKCSMEEGKSSSTCWCMTHPSKIIGENYSTCLCRDCYNED